MTDTATPEAEINPVVVRIDELMTTLTDGMIGEYLKFDAVSDMLLDLRNMAANN